MARSTPICCRLSTTARGAHHAQRGDAHHQPKCHEPHEQPEDGPCACGFQLKLVGKHGGLHTVLEEGALQVVGGLLRVHAFGDSEAVASDWYVEREQVVEERFRRQH